MCLQAHNIRHRAVFGLVRVKRAFHPAQECLKVLDDTLLSVRRFPSAYNPGITLPALYFPAAINCLIWATAKEILASVNILPISTVALV